MEFRYYKKSDVTAVRVYDNSIAIYKGRILIPEDGEKIGAGVLLVYLSSRKMKKHGIPKFPTEKEMIKITRS